MIKKIIRIAEQAVMFVCILGLTFRLLEIEMADMLLLIGLLTLGFLYLLIGFTILSNGSADLPIMQTGAPLTTSAKMIGAMSGMALSVAAVGICFRLLHWPAWQTMLVSGAIGCGVGLILSYIIVRAQDEKLSAYLNYRLMMTAGMCLLLMYSSL